MNTTSEGPRPLSRQQLRAIVYKIAVSYLEVERGLRPREQLAAFLSRAEYRRHASAPPALPNSVGPVRPLDIARVRIDSNTPERVCASALVRRPDHRWSTLLVDLHQVGRGWRVTKLDRLELILQRRPRHLEPPDDDLVRRINQIEGELALAVAARAAVEARIGGIGDRRARAARQLRLELDRLTGRIEELRTEGNGLRAPGRWRTECEVAAGREAGKRSFSTHDHEAAAAALGPRPDGPVEAEIWDDAVQVICSFRERWQLEGDEAILGPAATREQKADAQQLLERLRGVAEVIERSARHGHQGTALDPGGPCQTPDL